MKASILFMTLPTAAIAAVVRTTLHQTRSVLPKDVCRHPERKKKKEKTVICIGAT